VQDAIETYLDHLREGRLPPELPPCPLVTSQYDPDLDCQIGVAHFLLRPRFVLGDVTGFGKTPQALVAYGYLKWKDPATRLLVLCRLSSLPQWERNVHRFLTHQRVEILGYDAAQRELDKDARMDQVRRWTAGELDVLISTYHAPALDWSTRVQGPDDKKPRREFHFPELPTPLVTVLDEAQQFRGPGMMIYPMVEQLIEKSRYAWPMTATQLYTKLDDIYHIYNALRPGMLGVKADFDRRYYERVLIKIGKGKHGRRVWKITGTKNLWHLMDRIKPYYLRRETSKRPGVTLKVLEATLGPEQRKFYQEVLKQYVPMAQDAGDYKTAERLNARSQVERAAVLPKSSALTYAQFAVDAPEVLGFPLIPSAKMDELVRYLTEDAAGQRTIIFTRYEQVVTAICARLTKDGLKTVRITGKESLKQRDAAQTAFQTDPDTLVVLNSAGGEAIDLPAAQIVLFYDLPWGMGEFSQVLGRARRRSSLHSHVLAVLLGTQKTIDTRSLKLLQTREQLIDDTFGLHASDPRLLSITDTDPTYTAPRSEATGGGLAEPTPSFINDLFAALQQDVEDPW